MGRMLPLLLALILSVLWPAGLHAQSAAAPATVTVAWSPDSSLLAVGAGDGAVRVLDTETWRSLVTLRDHEAAIVTLTWSPDGRFLAAGAADGIMHVWDTETWRVVTTLEGLGSTAETGPAGAETGDAPEAESAATAPVANAPAETEAETGSETGPDTGAQVAAPAEEEPRAILDVSDFPAVAIEDAAADADGYYRLQTQWLEDENKCFEGGLPDPDRFLGGAAYMDDCQDVSGQLWTFVPADDGYYRLQTQWLQDENKCLESNRLDPERFLGGAAYMDDCQDVSGQFWAFVPADDGYYRLQSEWLQDENKCLEGNRPGAEWVLDGAAHMADCDDVTGQFWKIIPGAAPRAAAAAPARAATSAGPTDLLSFEAFGTWRRGDQPYGTFAQSSDPVHGGASAGKLTYDFSAATDADDFVVFTQRIAAAGEPNMVEAWVYGDGSGHLFNIWVEDANGEVWSVPMGAVSHTGWEQMAGAIDVNAPWPGGRIFGPDNGAIDYPLRLYGLVVDRTDGPVKGTLSFDDITFGVGDVPAAVAAPPADPCANIPGPSDDGVMVRFVNTSDDPVIVTWIDFDGNLDPERAFVVGPDDFQDQQSYPTHEWAILDLTRQRLNSYVVGDATTQCARIP